jgi:putative aminopeptidase FrvX
LNRLLTEMTPDEMIFVGRLWPEQAGSVEGKPGSGVLLGTSGTAQESSGGLAAELKTLAEKEQIPLQAISAKPPRIAGYVKGASLPARFAELGVPTLYPVTPAETVASSDEEKLARLLEAYLGIPMSAMDEGTRAESGGKKTTIAALTEAYGASGHEEAVRKVVLSELPAWAQKKAVTDAAGNLVLHLEDGKRNLKIPSVVFDAHMDEIGYKVKKIEDDGSLLVTVLGGGYTQYYLGHVALVHEADGKNVGGVMSLRTSTWERTRRRRRKSWGSRRAAL